MIDSRRLGS